jgi:hypothetical protein
LKKELNLEYFKIKHRLENFVWCSGRSGSTALYHSLPNCYHTHTFLYFLNQHGIGWNDIASEYNFNLFDILYLNINDYGSDKINIYDVYRTPIERKISAFFQYLDCIVKNNEIEILLSEVSKYQKFYSFNLSCVNVKNFVDYLSNNIKYLVELFLYFFFLKTDNYYSFLEFGAQAYISSKCNGYFHFKNYKFTFTILKFNQIRNWTEQIRKTSLQNIIIDQLNSSTSSIFGCLYNDFIYNLKIPKVLYDLVMYSDIQMHPLIPMCNHIKTMKMFMTKNEVCKYNEFWNKKLFITNSDSHLLDYSRGILQLN